MNAQTKIEAEKPTGLALLREPFPEHQISKLPKETRAQSDARKNDKSLIVWKCELCGGMHHKNAVHLDYVGHAAATDRLLDADPRWTWEPVPDPASLGLPTAPGGMWIKLTVDGVSRYGFGCADGKSGGDAIKEIIGDAIRNAGMRFGMALDLWHKGDLHLDDGGDDPEPKQPEDDDRKRRDDTRMISRPQWAKITDLLKATRASAKAILDHFDVDDLQKLTERQAMKVINQLEDKLTEQAKTGTNSASSGRTGNGADDLGDDEIPY